MRLSRPYTHTQYTCIWRHGKYAIIIIIIISIHFEIYFFLNKPNKNAMHCDLNTIQNELHTLKRHVKKWHIADIVHTRFTCIKNTFYASNCIQSYAKKKQAQPISNESKAGI